VAAFSPRERSEAVAEAVELLREGAAVALPTETVYGLAADALRADAVTKIFAAKERPRFDPLIIHLPDKEWVARVAVVEESASALFEQLSDRFWPGPLTFVMTRRAVIPDIVAAGLETVAVRISSQPVFAEVIRSFGGPLAAPSANRFGRISPTAASHVLEELDGRIPLIVDGGPTAHGLESTIVALRNNRIEILRRGPVSAEQLSEFGETIFIGPAAHPEAPGQLPSHYAPLTPLKLIDDAASFACPPGKRCGLLSWKSSGHAGFSTVRQLSGEGDLEEAAANLFRCLRELDAENLDLIVAEKVPEKGLGAAIMDRLRRAAAAKL
jgi:L-threonylcarbamoyladenylate synthase